jgi:hypothetical protein
MRSRLCRSVLALLALHCGALACAGGQAALLRGQAYYEDNQFERALAVWRDLERRERELSSTDFARYAYLRGMTDYRLGFHLDARHWLGLAKVAHQQHPSALDSAWSSRLDGALSDLNRRTFGLRGVDADSVQSIDAAPDALGPNAPAAPGNNPQAPLDGSSGQPPAPAGPAP